MSKRLTYYFLSKDGSLFHTASKEVIGEFNLAVSGQNGIVALNLNGDVDYGGTQYPHFEGDSGVVLFRQFRKPNSLFFTSPLQVNGEVIA